MAEKHQLQRSLGLVSATSIVAGSMIGSGIFIVTTLMARDIGSSGYMLLLWVLTGFLTMTAALTYGELAGMMPTAGGQFVYIQRAFGRLWSFLYGWTVFTVIQTCTIAAVAVAFANYTAVFFPALETKIFEAGAYVISLKQVLALLSILLLTYINTKGVRSGKAVQTTFTAAKLVAIFSLIFLGLYVGLQTDTLAANFADMWHPVKTSTDGSITELAGGALVGALGAAIINPLFSSDAWNNVTFIAGEIRDPKKNIPRSLFLGTAIVTVIYLLANLAYLSLLPLNGSPDGVSVLERGIMFADQDRVGAAAASVIFGNAGVLIMAGLIMVSTFGCNSGLILAGGRIFYAMAKDGMFFRQAGELNRHDVPAKALWVQCLWASLLCFSGTYGTLIKYATFASLLFYMVTILGVFRLRKTEPQADRPYRAFGFPALPIIYLLVTLGICGALFLYDTVNTAVAIGVVALGVPVYYGFLKKKA